MTNLYYNNLFEEVEPEQPPTSSDPQLWQQQRTPQQPDQPHVEQQPPHPQPKQQPQQIAQNHPRAKAEDVDEEVEDEDPDQQDDEDAEEPPGTSPAAGKKRKQELHRRHSKRYRDNLGELFQSLEQLLPKVVPNCKLKTKSQIIANSVQAVRRLRAEVSTLEMQFVLSSPANRTKWVEDTVTKSACFQEVAESFMRLLVGMQRWKHSELWSRYEAKQSQEDPESTAPPLSNTNSCNETSRSVGKKFLLRLERTASAHDITASTIPESYKMFSRLSQMETFVSGDESLVGRIASSLSPEWIDLREPDSCCSFKRVTSARECGFTICFAVPFLVRGHVYAAVLFYDDESRPNVTSEINIAQDLASSLGNCFGASGTVEAAEGNGRRFTEH